MDQRLLRPDRYYFSTRLQPCPYIAGQLERKVATDLVVPGGNDLFEKLSLLGFRRSHSFAYRPDCPDCSACIPIRVVAPDFAPGRSFRRTLRRNRDLTCEDLAALATREQYRLFTCYQTARHQGGEMSEMSYSLYRMMIEDTPVATRVVEFRYRDGNLAAVMLMDRMESALSAVYSFFDPDAADRSLGTYMILWMIRRAQRLGLSYVYLGYWIAGSEKMSYKVRFAPVEALGTHGWRILPGA